ncbi:polysaccharide deacetylase family protein [Sphingomonas sp.]|uniref:polysaccharide deacetylase family protein n=1 Tax=Sphingomonas sp. TaxID=28214 RepID=UPI0031D5318E
MRTLIIAILLTAASAVMMALTFPWTRAPGPSPGGSAARAAEPPSCTSALTGRTIGLPATGAGFGTSQHLPALPLAKGEYVITIDDGPNPATTPKLLDILGRYCVHATFMLVGQKIEAHPELVARIIGQGNGAGTHSYTHANFAQLNDNGRRMEIALGNAALVDALANARIPYHSSIFRFPGGPGVPNTPPAGWMATLTPLRLREVGWDWAGDDWSNAPAGISYARLFRHSGDRAVILLHDGPEHTLELLPMVLAEIERRGGRIVTLR